MIMEPNCEAKSGKRSRLLAALNNQKRKKIKRLLEVRDS